MPPGVRHAFGHTWDLGIGNFGIGNMVHWDLGIWWVWELDIGNLRIRNLVGLGFRNWEF